MQRFLKTYQNLDVRRNHGVLDAGSEYAEESWRNISVIKCITYMRN
jgi:hypothetical protein